MIFLKKEEEEERGGKRPFDVISLFILIFTVLFLPVTIIAISMFLLFMKWLKMKPSVIIGPVVLLSAVLSYILIGKVTTEINGFDFKSLDYIEMSILYLLICVQLGIIAGYILILKKAWDLKKYPEYKHISGWAYGFEYAATPLENWRRKQNIKSLKLGSMFDYEKAPIGIIDAPVKSDDLERTLDHKNANKASIVYRYYSEAMAHTLITGKTGSGKALHVETKIRIKEKGLTTVGNASVGDTLYDEFGNHTKLLAIYKPKTPDHYEIIFENGESIKACGDHLWNIGDVEKNKTFSTRILYENFDHKLPFYIRHSIDGERICHKMVGIKRIKDNPEDYVCFTVDSPSRLFLVTESNIPTHNTVTMLSLIQNDILAGHPVCVIDFKKSPDFIYFLSKWAKENNREFYHFVSGKPGTYKNPYKDDQASYDPLSTGGATSKADMILNLRTWDTASEVFKKRTQDVLQSLFFLLERTPREAVPGVEWDNGGLAQFVSALALDNFRKMIEHMGKDMTGGKLSEGDKRRYNTLIDLYKELSSKTKSDLKAQILELLSIARTLIVSNYGDWLATGASKYHIDLMKIATTENSPVVLFSFNQQEEPEFAKYIGSIVMSDLSRVSALKNAQGNTVKFGLYVDEFQTLDPRTVKDNLEKARSSRMYITLSLQSIDQIVSSVETGDGQAIANAIIDTCSNFIFHDGSGYDTAEKMSKIIGKSEKYVYKTTSNTRPGLISRLIKVDDAMVSKDIQEDWLIPPSDFQSLESPTPTNKYKATAFVVNKATDDDRFERSGGALARKIQVVVAEETADGVPTEFKEAIYIERGRKEDSKVIPTLFKEENYLEDLNLEENDTWTIEDLEEDEDSIENDIDALLGMNSSEKVEQKTPIKKEQTVERKISKLPPLEISNEPVIDIKHQKEKPSSQLDMFNQLKNKGATGTKEVRKKQVKPKKEPAEKKEESFKLPDLD